MRFRGLLLLRLWSRSGSRLPLSSGCRGLRLRLPALLVAQDGTATAGGIRPRHGEGERRHHKDDGRPCGRLGKQRGRAARAERRLAALSTERGGNVSALAVLQQHHADQEGANEYVNNGEK